MGFDKTDIVKEGKYRGRVWTKERMNDYLTVTSYSTKKCEHVYQWTNTSPDFEKAWNTHVRELRDLRDLLSRIAF